MSGRYPINCRQSPPCIIMMWQNYWHAPYCYKPYSADPGDRHGTCRAKPDCRPNGGLRARCGGTVTETGIAPYCHDTCPNTGDDGLSGVRFNITLVHQPQPCNNPACIADKRQCFMYVLGQYAVTYLLQSRDAFHVGHGSYMVTVPCHAASALITARSTNTKTPRRTIPTDAPEEQL